VRRKARRTLQFLSHLTPRIPAVLGTPLKIPSLGGVARSAGVGSFLTPNNPLRCSSLLKEKSKGVGTQSPPEVPPCPRGDDSFPPRCHLQCWAWWAPTRIERL